MSTVQEIRDAITRLPEGELFELIQWLHTHHDWDATEDPEVKASIERGEKQLDAGEGMLLEDVRKLTPTWTTK